MENKVKSLAQLERLRELVRQGAMTQATLDAMLEGVKVERLPERYHAPSVRRAGVHTR